MLIGYSDVDDTHTSTHTSTRTSLDESVSTLSKYKAVSYCNRHRRKERKGNDENCWAEEPPKFP